MEIDSIQDDTQNLIPLRSHAWVQGHVQESTISLIFWSCVPCVWPIHKKCSYAKSFH